MDKRFVCIHHLLQVEVAIHIMREGGCLVELFVKLYQVFLAERRINMYDFRTKNATGEVATIGNEIQRGIKAWLQLRQGLTNLGHMLMAEGLVDAHVACAPGEVGGRTWFHACSRRTRDGINTDVTV